MRLSPTDAASCNETFGGAAGGARRDDGSQRGSSTSVCSRSSCSARPLPSPVQDAAWSPAATRRLAEDPALRHRGVDVATGSSRLTSPDVRAGSLQAILFAAPPPPAQVAQFAASGALDASRRGAAVVVGASRSRADGIRRRAPAELCPQPACSRPVVEAHWFHTTGADDLDAGARAEAASRFCPALRSFVASLEASPPSYARSPADAERRSPEGGTEVSGGHTDWLRRIRCPTLRAHGFLPQKSVWNAHRPR
jgi:hypothetical protein